MVRPAVARLAPSGDLIERREHGRRRLAGGPERRAPQPISEAEAARILNTKEEAASAAPKARVHVDYDIGDTVKVTSGNFATFSGIVEELDFDKSRVKVSISIFGRATPLELGFEDVERVK
jgi:transcriptional antiterminator NusG